MLRKKITAPTAGFRGYDHAAISPFRVVVLRGIWYDGDVYASAALSRSERMYGCQRGQA